MKDDFSNISDNEFDDVFRKVVEQMDLTPSEETRNKIKAGILERENSLFRRKFIMWRTIATSLLAALLLGVSYTFNLQYKVSSAKSEITKKELNTTPLSSVQVESLGKENTSADRTTTLKTPFQNNSGEPQQSISTIESKPEYPENKFVQSQVTHKQGVQYNTNKNELNKVNTNSKVFLVPENNTPEGTTNMTFESYKNVPLDFVLEKNQVELKTNFDTTLIGSTTAIPVPDSLNKTSTKGSRFFVSAFYTPSMAKYMLKDNNMSDNVTVADVNARQENKYSYSVGVKLGYDLNKKWSAQIGCLYSVSTIDIKPFSIYCQQATSGNLYYSCITSMGVVQFPAEKGQWAGDAMTVMGNSSQTVGLISVPLQLLYNIPYKKFIFYTSPGITTNIMVQSQTNMTYSYNGGIENKEFSSIYGLKTVSYQFILGVGARYNIYKHFYIAAEPTFRTALMAMNNNNAPIKNYPFLFGLNLGLVYHF